MFLFDSTSTPNFILPQCGFVYQPSKVTVISEDITHDEAIFGFKDMFYYNWHNMQQDNKKTNFKKYCVSLNEMASQCIVLESFYKATTGKLMTTSDPLEITHCPIIVTSPRQSGRQRQQQ